MIDLLILATTSPDRRVLPRVNSPRASRFAVRCGGPQRSLLRLLIVAPLGFIEWGTNA